MLKGCPPRAESAREFWAPTARPLFCTIEPNPSESLPDWGLNAVCRLNTPNRPSVNSCLPFRPTYEPPNGLGATPNCEPLLFLAMREFHPAPAELVSGEQWIS